MNKIPTPLTDALVEFNVSRDGMIEHGRHMEEQRWELIQAVRMFVNHPDPASIAKGRALLLEILGKEAA